jgi:hypothetical protein
MTAPVSATVPSDNQLASLMIPSVVDDNGNGELIKRGRVKTARDLASIHVGLVNEDLEASRKRAMVDAAIGGEAPYDADKDRRLGISGRSNINWGDLAQAVEEAQMPYFRLLETLDTLCTTPTKYGDADTRVNLEPVLAEEISRMIRNDPSFLPMWGQLTLLYVSDGVGFTLFADGISWKSQVKGMQYLKFPRRTRADVNYLDVVTCEDQMRPDELYNKVQSEENLPEGEKRYWNREACLQAIKETSGSQGLDTNNPETIAEAWKNNDLSQGMTANTVRVVHGYIKELDGTVSHYVSRYDGVGEFLYKCEGKFTNISQLLTAFIGNVGTNGDFHSVRGLGYKLFTSTAGKNRLLNKFLDQACIAATPHLSTSNEDANIEQMIRPMGPYMLMADGTSFQEIQTPDFSQTLIPALGYMDANYRSRAAASAPVAVAQLSRTQKTATEVQSNAEQQGALQASGFSMFMAAWERHLRCVIKRAIREDYQITDPGGPEVFEMRKRLLLRNVPLKALYSIDVDAIEVNTGLGKGSVSERRAVVGALNEMLWPRLDEKGRTILDRMTAASYAGMQIAKLLVPDTAGMRPPVDAQVAQLENSLMAMGQPPAFEPNQDHVVHVDKHLAYLYQVNTALTQMQIELRPAIDQMQPVWEHCINDHMPLIDPRNPDYSRFKAASQQLGELIKNSRKHLDAEDQREAEKAAEEQGQQAPADQYGGTPGGLFAAAVDANARAADKDAAVIDKTRAETQIALEKHRQQMAANDVKLALDVQKANQPKTAK